MITFTQNGNFNKTEKFLKKVSNGDYIDSILNRYGRMGVAALSSETPVDTGKTASSWDFEVHRSRGSVSIYWTNSNVNNGVSIAIILQYGHGTRNGGYVQGRDYINPPMAAIFDEMTQALWREVTSA